MKRYLQILLLCGCFGLLAACGDDCDGSGRCDCCESDSDCDDGLQCLGFFNSSGVYERCATTSTRSCPN